MISEKVLRLARAVEEREKDGFKHCRHVSCILRATFQVNNLRKMTPEDCPKTCYYHPSSRGRLVDTSPGRSRRSGY